MGSYLLLNTKKLRASKASPEIPNYRAWCLSELPVHAATGYKSYVDDSAWMANLWLGWTMEFFVEMFALLHEGRDTKASVEIAYKQTLEQHHNFFQRTAFQQAVKQLPVRQKMIAALQGSSAKSLDVVRDMGDFVAFGRPIVRFCLQLNEELSSRMTEERKAYLKR
uniref:Glycolipid transfer protein domain-containing protein n=1 Tax=Strombidinopsis acuminata TaxID=141414 RepID=A0A7S3SRW2_9SPIT